jgi:hypothetical protein
VCDWGIPATWRFPNTVPAQRRHPRDGPHKTVDGQHMGKSNAKLHLPVDGIGRQPIVIAAVGTESDRRLALEPISSVDMDFVLADKTYDSDETFSLKYRFVCPAFHICSISLFAG